MDALDYIEREGQANMAQHLAQYEVLMKRAQALALLLLGGGGALGGLALQQWGQARALSRPLADTVLVAAGAGAAWWFALAGLLAVFVMRSRKVPTAHNEPGHLWEAFEQIRHAAGQGDDAALAQLRVRELQGLHGRVQRMRAASDGVAARLNRVTLAAAATPLAVGLITWVARG